METENPRQISAASRLGLGAHEVWSTSDNARVFIEAVRLILEKRGGEVGGMKFDKDDTLAVEFVTAAANLRMASFHIPTQTLFNAKGIAGNIIHAIATTNAIISGLVVIEATKIVCGQLDKCRLTFCLEHPSRSGKRTLILRPSPLEKANPKCYVCQQASLVLEVNTKVATLGEVVAKAVVKGMSVVSPMVYQGNSVLYEMGEDLEEDERKAYATNAERVLAQFATPISNGTVLLVEDLQQELKCSLHIVHREDFDEEKEPDGMVLKGDLPEAKAASAETTGTNGQDQKGGAQDDEEEVECLGDREQILKKRKREGDREAETESKQVAKRTKVLTDGFIDLDD